MKRVHLWISGRVQGVFFRAYTKEQAQLLGLVGWVRNLPSGEVEAVFEGPENQVAEMVKWCQHGPPHAVVRAIQIKEETPTGEFTGFDIRY